MLDVNECETVFVATCNVQSVYTLQRLLVQEWKNTCRNRAHFAYELIHAGI